MQDCAHGFPHVSSIGLIFISVLPTVLQDIIHEADKWGNRSDSGRINPFIEINDVGPLFLSCRIHDGRVYLILPFQLVLVMIARLTTCHDLAKNEVDLKRIGELFMTHQASFTPTALLLPWFPSPAKKAGRSAATELFTMLYTYVERRRRAEPTNDAIDILIADGETTKKIVGVCLVPSDV